MGSQGYDDGKTRSTLLENCSLTPPGSYTERDLRNGTLIARVWSCGRVHGGMEKGSCPTPGRFWMRGNSRKSGGLCMWA